MPKTIKCSNYNKRKGNTIMIRSNTTENEDKTNRDSKTISKQSLSVLKSRSNKMSVNSIQLWDIKANFLINECNAMMGSSVLSPKSKAKLRQIDIRKHGLFQFQSTYNYSNYNNDYYEENKQNNKHALTENLNSLFKLSSTKYNKPIFKAKDSEWSNPYPHSHQSQYHLREFNINLDNKYSIKTNNNLIISPLLNRTKRNNNSTKLIEYNSTKSFETIKKKPMMDLFRLPIEKRIKSSIEYLKNFKFSVDVHAKPDEIKHQKTIHNNLMVLTEIRNRLKTDISDIKNTEIEDESISILMD